MFSTLPSLQVFPSQNSHSYKAISGYHHTPRTSSPLCSSPLSPQSNNAVSPRVFTMSSPTPSYKSQSSSQPQVAHPKSSPYSKRVTKTNPLLHNRGDGRETRRKLFLRKVREDSEDKRWKARGGDDEMMRTIWVAEQKRMEERRLRDPDAEVFPDEEEDMLNSDQIMADEVARIQDEEIEAFLSSMDDLDSFPRNDMLVAHHMDLNFASSRGHETRESVQQHGGTSYGSDDDDYDHIFRDVIRQESKQMANQEPLGDVEMDLS